MTIDYYLALGSPYSYMGHARILALSKQYGATLHCKPVQFGKVFAVSGGLPVKDRPKQRQAYRFQELRRWGEHLGLPLKLEPKHFPAAEAEAAKLVIALRLQGGDPGPLIGAFQRAVWAEERDISDAGTIRAIATETSLDADALLAAAADPSVQAAYDADTEEAIARGVFGAPTYAIGDELYWGQDRLDFVERHLQRR